MWKPQVARLLTRGCSGNKMLLFKVVNVQFYPCRGQCVKIYSTAEYEHGLGINANIRSNSNLGRKTANVWGLISEPSHDPSISFVSKRSARDRPAIEE